MKPCLFACFLNCWPGQSNLIPDKFRWYARWHGLTRTDNRRLSLTIIIQCKYKRKIDICQVLADESQVRRKGKNQNENQGSFFLFSTISAPPVFSARFQHELKMESLRCAQNAHKTRTVIAQNAHKRLVLIFFGKFSFFLGWPYRLFLIIFENQYVMIDKFYLTLMGRFIVQEETSGKVSCGGWLSCLLYESG